MELTQFIESVKRMRQLQSEYFKNRDKNILIAAKQSERDVDNALPSVEHKIKSGQRDLFTGSIGTL